jgi:hypothetical protein
MGGILALERTRLLWHRYYYEQQRILIRSSVGATTYAPCGRLHFLNTENLSDAELQNFLRHWMLERVRYGLEQAVAVRTPMGRVHESQGRHQLGQKTTIVDC